MTKLYKFTHDAFRWLSGHIKENAEHYKDPHADFASLLQENGIEKYWVPSGIEINGDTISLKPPKDQNTSKRHLADKQALDFYHSLEGMTPRLASEPEILAYINHMYLHGYGIIRWPHRESNTIISNIQQHWLTNAGQRTVLYKGSISGRTWWIAHVATKAAEASNGAFDAKEALDVFARTPEFYHRTMEYVVLRNPSMMAECIRVLLHEARGINSKGYIEMAREINREAGARLLDSLDIPEVRKLVGRTADAQMRKPEYVTDRHYLKGVKKYKVLSLGAGTQSTVLALMANEGWGGLEKPDIAMFADTQWEPKPVYDHLDWLEKQLSYKVVRVTAGNIRKNILNGVTPRGDKFLDLPLFLKNEDGPDSVAARQCTNHYKIQPIHRKLREMLKLEPGKRAPKDVQVEMWMGISADESHRKKDSRDEWITNRYPLVDMELTRAHLYSWFSERYPGRVLPRSACAGCPYHTNMEWKWLKDNDPESFRDAVFVDRAIREIPDLRSIMKGKAYLHRDKKNLDEVDFSQTDDYDDHMLNECEGLCGL